MKGLNEDIKNRRFCPVYLLYGEEAYLKNQYKNRLRSAILPEGDTMNFSFYEGKGLDVNQVIEQAETMPFFAEHRLILIENSGFFKNACPQLADYLPRMPQETIVVFVENEVDKRGKLYKAVKSQGRVTELGRQDVRTLKAWVLGMIKREQKQITGDALALFLEMAGDDMEHIANELEKVISYVLDKDSIDRSDIEEICTVPTENKVFDMIHAVAEKQQKKALKLYYDLLAWKEPPMRILFLTARQFNQLFQVKDLREQGYDDQTIASRAGIKPFIARRCIAQAKHFSREQLENAVKDCVEAEEAIKTGRLGDRLALEMLIIKYSQPTS